jgi:hypothetical protein
MPNVSCFIPTQWMPEEAALDRFTDECTELCTGVLNAGLDKVHIIFVPVLSNGRGQKAYIEIKYRVESFRPAHVMTEFIGKLDAVAKKELGLTARIRCFGSAPDAIYALN